MNGSRFNGRSRGTRMFQNSERGNGPGSNNSSGFSQPIDTWFNPTNKESKKGNKKKKKLITFITCES